MYRRRFFLFIFCLFIFKIIYAREVIILYTGSTEACLYPSYPARNLIGGVSRRSTLINQIRKNNPHTILLDAGNSFAKPESKEANVDLSLYKLRTQINLKAMKIMQYDAVNIGIEEFNLGEDFLIENLKNSSLLFTSCNLILSEPQILHPYVIKEVAGIKFGIVGVTNLSAMDKAKEIRFQDPFRALKNTVSKIKKDVDFIIVLSSLGEYHDRRIIQEIKEIDIIINGGFRENKDSYSKLDNVILLRCSMKGAYLGKLTLNIKDKRIQSFKVEEIPLSEKIKDDSQINSFLPSCFFDNDCKKEGMLGLCQNPGTPQAQCLF
ncbi:MAG: hypothetical protein N2Z79_00215, partial [Candidatus Omnitrophica bacterium]|nr:hypothetical protein [Candidatus Omnitrophota bacterium]